MHEVMLIFICEGEESYNYCLTHFINVLWDTFHLEQKIITQHK